MPPNISRLPSLRVYLDETGDRGFKTTSSRMFGFCAVLIPEEHDTDLRTAVQGLRHDFNITAGALHWKDHLTPRFHERRRHAANRLAEVPGVQLIYSMIDKPNVPVTAGIHGDIVKTYNYATRLLFERIACAARDWPGGSRRTIIKVAHVRGHDHTGTLDYITRVCPSAPSFVSIPWDLAISNIRVEGASTYDGLQAADVYAGMFNAAILPDKFGNNWPDYLLTVGHQVRRGPNGKILNFGIKILGDDSIVTNQDWWPKLEN